MNLAHIRAFVTAAGLGNLSRAAAVLHLTQPALSKQIRILERDLGVQLFDRMGRGVQLTSAGQDLLQSGRQLLLHAEGLVERAQLSRAGATGVLKVGATSMTLESFLAPFLPGYRRRWPNVEVHLAEDGGVRLLRQVAQGDLHLAITLPIEPSLCSRLLFPVRCLAVMTRDHRLARRRTVDLPQLADEPLLVLRPEFTMRQLFDAACRVTGLRPRFMLETNVPHALLALARYRYGIALVPSNQRIERGPLATVPILHQGKSLGQWMVVNWYPRRLLPPFAETFMSDLTAYTMRAFPGREFSYASAPPRPDGSER